MRVVFALVRAFLYASLFLTLVLFLIPAWTLESAGIGRPPGTGPMQVAGIVIAVLGLGLALWSVVVFAVVGRGTPAPFDPPRRLVARGPYRFVRNPMAMGIGSALVGAALFYRSWQLAVVAAVFFVILHLFVVLYEEPTLLRTFGEDYAAYRGAVRRWWPRWKGYRP
jgi:protein-S-isoprenylcysteine O-methyltransferase Ste14